MKSLPLLALLSFACASPSKPSGTPGAPESAVEVLHVKHADAFELSRTLSGVCLRSGTDDVVVADPRTNSIVVRTSDARTLALVRETVARLDVEVVEPK